MKTKIAAVVIMCSSVLAAGCQQQVRMKYKAELGKVVPFVKAGDVLIWDTDIQFSQTGSPCALTQVKAGETGCVVSEDAKGNTYGYSCASTNCDPEIAVDDGKSLQETRRFGFVRSADNLVHLGCSGTSAQPDTKTIVDPSDLTPRVGETVQWFSDGTHSLENWYVTVQSDKLCVGGTTTFKQGDQCRIASPGGTRYTYSVNSTNCKSAGAGTVTPQ